MRYRVRVNVPSRINPPLHFTDNRLRIIPPVTTAIESGIALAVMIGSSELI